MIRSLSPQICNLFYEREGGLLNCFFFNLMIYQDCFFKRAHGDVVDSCCRLGGDYFKNIGVLTTDFGGTPQFPFKTLKMPAWE